MKKSLVPLLLLMVAVPASAQIVVANARNSDASVLLFPNDFRGRLLLGISNGLGSPRRLAVDPLTGDLFVSDAFVQRVFRRSAEGSLSTFADASDGIGNATGLAFDAAGRLYVSNSRNSAASVLIFERDGSGRQILGLGDGLGSPRGLAIDALTGDLFVADAFVQRVFRWSAVGGLSTFADASDGVGNASGLAFDPAGRLYVSNARNSDASVLVFERDGTGQEILGLADGLGSPRGLAFDSLSGDLFIADVFAQIVFRWNATNGLSTYLDSSDGIGNPEGLAAAALLGAGIPSISRGGQILLALLLAGVGLAAMRRLLP